MKNKLTKTGVLILIGLLFTLGWACQLSGPSAPATPKEEKLIDVSFEAGAKGGLQSKSLSGMIVYAKSFSTTDRTQLGTTRTLTENPSGSGRYTGTVSVGDGTAAKATVYIYGVLNNRVRAFGYTDIALPRSTLITLPYSTAGYTAGDMGPGGGFIVDVDKKNHLYTELAPASWKGKAADNIYFWDLPDSLGAYTTIGTFTAEKKGLDNVTLLDAAITTDDYWTAVKTIKVNAGGSGYIATDKLKLTGGDGKAEASITVTDGVIKTLYGFSFVADDELVPVAPGSISTITPDGGFGYAVDDELALTGDTSGATGATVKVKAVLDDVVWGITCFDAGDGYKAGDKVIVGGAGGPEVTIDTISGTGTTGPIATYHLSSLAYNREPGHNITDNKGSAKWDIEVGGLDDGVISQVELTEGGDSYTVDETCTPSGGHGTTNAVFKVKEVIDGIIDTATIIAGKEGKNYNKGSCAFTGGSGTGAKLEITAVDEYAYAIHAFRDGIDFNGLDDWTFPTKDDLTAVNTTFAAGSADAGLTAGKKYWSSSEVDDDQAYTLVVGTGVDNTESKDSKGLYVRPVRYF